MTEQAKKTPHKWVSSTLGHGETMCEYCRGTNREIAVVGDLNHCSVASAAAVAPPSELSDLIAWAEDHVATLTPDQLREMQRQQAESWARGEADLDRVPKPIDARASFQARVQPWMLACFGPEISADTLERGDRLIEEVLELLQSVHYPRERIRALEDYVFGRDIGHPAQEVGGVMVTLAAFCLAHGIGMHGAGETEPSRINTPEMIAKIRAKQAAKPTGSALPVAILLDAQDCVPYGHRVIEQAEMLDGRVCQTVSHPDGSEYQRVVHADEAFGAQHVE